MTLYSNSLYIFLSHIHISINLSSLCYYRVYTYSDTFITILSAIKNVIVSCSHVLSQFHSLFLPLCYI